MKCPKCGYVSHDYLNACRKCSVDLLGFKAQMQLHVVQAGNIDLRSVLGGVQPSPIASGEFNPGEIFDSAMLIDTQVETGFDISLDDDFSFTPSAMSLESLDGFEVSNIESMQLEQQRPADTPPSAESPDTDYATVMMDTSGLHGDTPPLESAGDAFDAPLEIASPDLDAPIESAEAIIDLPALPLDAPLAEPEINQAELRSSVGRTSDLDLTSMELRRTTRDIEMMNQLKSEALSGDTVLPEFNLPIANDESAAPVAPEPYSGDDLEPIHDASDQSDTGVINALIDDTVSPFAQTIPEVPSQEAAGTDDFSEESGELTLPAFDTDFPSIEAVEDASSSGSSSRNPEDAFTMPDLPEIDAEEKPVNPFTEEISLAIDPLAPPEPPPMTFPSLQTTILPTPDVPPLSDEAPLVDEASTAEPVEPAIEDTTEGSPDTGSMTTELDLDHAASPLSDDAFLTASPHDVTISDEQSPLLTAEPDAVPSGDASFATIAMDISHSPSPGTPDDTPIFPDLPESADDAFIPFTDEVTIVDEPSPFASTDRPPVAPTDVPTDTKSATVALDIGDMQPLDTPVMPELPEPTDAFVPPSHDEPTIVDEPSPFAASGQTPVDSSATPSETIQTDVDTDAIDDDSDLELLFPDEQPPQQRD